MKNEANFINNIDGLAKIMNCCYWDLALGKRKSITGVLGIKYGKK